MDEELKQRFLKKMLDELLTNSTKPFPTMLCEMDDPKIIELVRKFCLFTPNMIPFGVRNNLILVPERLDTTRGKTDYGMLYIEVYTN